MSYSNIHTNQAEEFSGKEKDDSAIEIEVDPMLTEEVVLSELNRRDLTQDGDAIEDYHQRVDPLYDLPSKEKMAKFKEIHADLFSVFGFEKILKEILDEFPLINNRIKKIYFLRAIKEEIADLTTDDEFQGEKSDKQPDTVIARLSADSFSNIEHLNMVTRHELMHIHDMLDENFGYKLILPALPPLEKTLVINKYRIIWDIYIDTRILRNGQNTIRDKDAHYKDFDSTYLKIPKLERKQIFEGLWEIETLTHDEILELSRDVNKLISKFTSHKEKIFLPGNPCPLCKFPTYDWMTNLEDRTDEEVILIIQKEFPNWTPNDGACERCIECYHTLSPKT